MAKITKDVHRDWRQPQFWRDVFLLFWCFSFAGHVLEILLALPSSAIGFRETPISTIPLFAIAVPYGLGAVVLWLLLYPLVKKKRISLVMAFVVGTLVATIVELVCALLLVAFTGHNYFWDYSNRFMNLNGYICLGNSVIFGLGSVAALWWAFPMTEKVLTRVRERYINIAFWILFVGYILSQIYIRLVKG